MSPTADQLVHDYLERLDAELAGLPRARRREVVQEISEHIAEARSDPAAEGEAGIRTLLDRLGDPADIGAEARQRFGVQPRRPGWIEVAALVLLLVGGVVVPVLGWFAGAVLLWASQIWTTRDKLIGTLVVPGGLALPLALALFAPGSTETCSQVVDLATGATTQETCTGGTSDAAQAVGLVVLAVAALAPLGTSAYLARRMRSAG